MSKAFVKRENRNIHFVHFSSQPGGIEVLLPVIVNNLTDFDFKGFVIREPVLGAKNIYDYLLEIPVEYGSNSKIKALIRAFYYFKKYRDDVIQAFNIGPVFLILARLAGVKKLVYCIHGTIYWKNKWQEILLKPLWYSAFSGEYKIISNSEYSKKVFADKITSSADIQVIYNPVDGNIFTPAKINTPHHSLKIIYSGRLCKGKNLERWLETASEIHDLLPITKFEIYGTGPLIKILKDQIRQQNAGNYIKLKGFRENIANVYREADLLLFISEYESFGNVAVESILCGTPAIVSDIPSMKEIFRDFPEFIIKIDDNMKDTVLSKLNELSKLKELALKARDQFLIRFSVKAHTTALNRIYKSFNG